MLDLQRVELLATMGLKTLQPRFQLSAAKPSVALSPLENILTPAPAEASEAVVAGVETSGTLVEQAAQILQQQKMQNVTGQLAGVSQVLTVDTAVSAVANTTDAPTLLENKVDKEDEKLIDKPLRFRQRLLRCGEFLMLIDQPALQWQEERQAKQFFDELYYAFNRKRAEFFASEVFEWPPTRNFPNAHNIDTARATFNGFLQPKMNNPECVWIICWGEAAAKNFIDAEFEVGKIIEFQGRSVLMVNELTSYWQQPESKRLLWLDLQNLKKTLISH